MSWIFLIEDIFTFTHPSRKFYSIYSKINTFWPPVIGMKGFDWHLVKFEI